MRPNKWNRNRGSFKVLLVGLIFSHASLSQVNSEAYYSFSYGFQKADHLIDFNEQLLNEGHRPLQQYGQNISAAINQSINQVNLQLYGDFGAFQNKPNSTQAKILASQVSLGLAFGYDVLKSDRFRLIPACGFGMVRNNLNFEFPDTANSLSNILAGNANTANVNTKLTFLLNPKLQFSFASQQGQKDGFLIETGYYYTPYRLQWKISDVSLSRFAGFYFRIGFYFPHFSK